MSREVKYIGIEVVRDPGTHPGIADYRRLPDLDRYKKALNCLSSSDFSILKN